MPPGDSLRRCPCVPQPIGLVGWVPAVGRGLRQWARRPAVILLVGGLGIDDVLRVLAVLGRRTDAVRRVAGRVRAVGVGAVRAPSVVPVVAVVGAADVAEVLREAQSEKVTTHAPDPL